MKRHFPLSSLLFFFSIPSVHFTYADNSDPLPTIFVTEVSIENDEDIELSEFGLLESEFTGTVDILDDNTPHLADSTRLEDYIETIPGVQTGRLQAGLGTDLYIRGFSTGGVLYKDGLVDNRKYYIRDPASVERVEIIKGRDSVLYGSGSPGGSVNYIIKKPKEAFQKTIKTTMGSPTRARFEFDSTGPIRRSQSMFYRFIAVRQEAEVGRDNVDDDRLMLMPSILLKNETTQLRFLAEYSNQQREFDFDTVLRLGEPVFNTSFSGPRNDSERISKSIDFDFKHQLSNNWLLNIKANRYQVDRDELLSGFFYKEDEDTLIGYYREIENDHSQRALVAELKGDIEIGNSFHHTTLGYERNKMKSILTSRRFSDYTLDILNPQFDFPTPTRDQLNDYDYDEGDNNKSFYLHDKIDIGDQLIFRAGLRYSEFYRDFYRLGILYPLTDTDTLSSSLGMTYQPSDNWAYYASRSESFTPNIGRSKSNEYFAPKEGLQYEVGLRYSSNKSQREIKAGIYQLTQSNLTTVDPDDRDFRILAGEREVKGLEISGKTPLVGKLDFSFGYSYMDGEITKNNDGLQGNTPGNLPTHSGSLNFSYVMKNRFNQNMRTDLGIIAVSDKKVSDRNKFSVAGYTRFDVNVRYPISKKTELNFSIKNLLDKDYIAAPIVEDVLVEGYPRRILLSVKHNF